MSLYGRAAFSCLLSVCEAAYVLLCIPSELIYMRHRAQYLAEIEIPEAATTYSFKWLKRFLYADDTQLSNLPSKFQFSPLTVE